MLVPTMALDQAWSEMTVTLLRYTTAVAIEIIKQIIVVMVTMHTKWRKTISNILIS